MADLLVAELPETVTQLLDIGCGTGASLLASAAARPSAHCTGLDISAPMLALARQRAEAAGLDADFIVADAQQHPLPTAHFDWIQSRLGVMFFEDTGAAFANLHRATRPGAGLRFIARRSADENPFMTTAERAIGDALELPPRAPGAQDSSPSQMANACSACCRLPAGRMWRWLRWTFRVRSHAMSCRPTSASWARWASAAGAARSGGRRAARPSAGSIHTIHRGRSGPRGCCLLVDPRTRMTQKGNGGIKSSMSLPCRERLNPSVPFSSTVPRRRRPGAIRSAHTTAATRR